MILSKDKDTSRELSEQSFTTQEEVVLFLKSTSETHINTSTTPNISSLLKELTQDNTYSVEERLPSQQVTSSQSIESQKVQPSATFNPQLETRELIPDVQEHTQPLLDIQMMAAEPESDSHQEPEKPFLVFAELPLE